MKVFATGQLPGRALERVAQQCDLDIWEHRRPPASDELIERLNGCQGLLCMLTNRIDSALLNACPQLQFVSSMSVGVDHVDLKSLTRRAIPLGHTPGVLVDTTADLAFALLLAAARRIPEGDDFVRGGHWDPAEPWHPDLLVGRDLAGATLGILGLGSIGQAVARRAAGFSMDVIAWNRSPRQVEGIEQVDFDGLLARSDFLSVHVALSDQTRNMIDAKALAKMKPGAVLVNTARGGIVDEHALAQALRSGQLFAAGVDVFSSEPVEPTNPLLVLSNVVLAPHIGSATRRTRERMAALAADNLLAALSGEPMPHCANPEVYSTSPE